MKQLCGEMLMLTLVFAPPQRESEEAPGAAHGSKALFETQGF